MTAPVRERTLEEALAEVVRLRRDDLSPAEWEQLQSRICKRLQANYGSSALAWQDFEELASDAYLELLSQLQAGNSIDSPLGFMNLVARRAATKRHERGSGANEIATDPSTVAFDRAAPGGEMDERVDFKAQIARTFAAIADLPEEQQRAFAAHFLEEDPSAAITAKRLGCSRATLYNRLGSAINAAQAVGAGADPLRAVIARYVAGLTEGSERRRIARLLSTDPQARAMAVELRRTFRGAAALLPPVFVVDDGLSLTDRLAAVYLRVREALPGGGGEDLVGGALPSAAGGGVGATGTGLAAKFGLLGGGTKALLGCLATGAAVTTCVVAGLIPDADLTGGKKHAEAGAAAPKKHRESRSSTSGVVSGPGYSPIPETTAAGNPASTSGGGGQDRSSADSEREGDGSGERGGGAPGADSGPNNTPVAQPDPAVQEFTPAPAPAPEPAPTPAPSPPADSGGSGVEFGP